MEKEILSIADASQLLSLSEAEVERLLHEGELPFNRPNLLRITGGHACQRYLTRDVQKDVGGRIKQIDETFNR